MLQQSQKKYLKLAFLYTFLTGVFIFLILKFGLSAAITLSEFIQKGKPGSAKTPVESILPSPQVYPLPTATNSADLVLWGYSLPNLKVDVFINDLNVKTFEVNSEGKFEGSISLPLGENTLYTVTTDSQGRQSPASETQNIFFSNSPPYIEITEPAKDEVVKKNPDIFIKGRINDTSKVTINDHKIITTPDTQNGYNLFSYPARLESGDNTFKVVCIDPADNRQEINYLIRFQP